MGKNTSLPEFDKFLYYTQSVQSPDVDVKFLRKVYRKTNDRKPKSMREDFCSTFKICCEWVKLDSDFHATGVDLDTEGTSYGFDHYVSELKKEEQQRINIIQDNVLTVDSKGHDIINALNFSYFIFKERETLKKYFKNVFESLNTDGLFVLDIFGGSEVNELHEEETEHDDFSYYWDQDTYNPINNEAQFHIHFKRKGEKKRRRVFSYDWRVWSIPEVRDILNEVGFKSCDIYWEGTDKDGEGDGVYKKTQVGESDCESWVAYIIAKKS